MSEKEYPVKIDEAELAKRVDPLSYAVLRKAATETAFTGEYTETETIGIYKCKACDAELFKSDSKFHSGCGWPSFYQPSAGDAVELIRRSIISSTYSYRGALCCMWISLGTCLRGRRVCGSHRSTLVY
jgi:peptide methionine sulfoxide reductase MsrB